METGRGGLEVQAKREDADERDPDEPDVLPGVHRPREIGGLAANEMFGSTLSPKTRPIWGTRYPSAGIVLSSPKRVVNPRAPIVALRSLGIGLTAKFSLWRQ